MLYMIIAQEYSFNPFGSFSVIDFRLIGFFFCSVIFFVSISGVVYNKYCLDYNQTPESFSVLFQKYSVFNVGEAWLDYHKYIFFAFFGYLLLVLAGFAIKNYFFIVFGYLGVNASILLTPKTIYSNLIYKVLIISAVLVFSILGQIDDPLLVQIYAFYPSFYIHDMLFFVVRVFFTGIGLINASKYKSTHFISSTAWDIYSEFILGYFCTVVFIVLKENESN